MAAVKGQRACAPPVTETKKALIFDIWGDYAHFKRIETTTSPLTYLVPTGTALLGLTAAIIGLERDSYYELFSPEAAKLAIRILNPLKKTRINLNLINTKAGFFLRGVRNPRTRIPFEFLKDPKFRIYFWTKHAEIYRKLRLYLMNHHSFYTPYLGISELIASFEYVGEHNIKEAVSAEDEKLIHTIIRRDKAKLIVEEGKRYGHERIPLYRDKDGIVREYADVLFEMKGEPLKILGGECCTIGADNVIFV